MKKEKKINKYLIMIKNFFKNNIPFMLFILFCLLNTSFLRLFTIGNFFNIKAILFDISSLIVIGSFYFLFNKKNYIYLYVMSFIIMLLNTIHGIYYSFFSSFASFELLETASQATTQGSAIFDKLNFSHFIYLIIFILFIVVITIYNKKYKYKKNKLCFRFVLLIGVISLVINSLFLTNSDLSRLVKLWNREYVVDRYGVLIYNVDDLISSLSTSFASEFKEDEAVENFNNFFLDNTYSNKKNSYSNIYEGYNVIVFHMESVMSFLVDYKINGKYVTPNLNKLVKESMYFDNFYAQNSVGTSSDTEFSINTSLMPVKSGTVFVSYTDRSYISLESLLHDKGYYTFSMHANKGSMWNRNRMHPSLGYDKLYDMEYYEYDKETETVGLGLNDSSFLRQSKDIIDNFEYDKYMGTIITLSNHTPFEVEGQIPEEDLFDVTYHTGKKDSNGNEIVYDYLKGTSIGKYIQNVHYADKCFGEFIDSIKKDKRYNNTLFIFYGDHPAQLSKSQFNKIVNYNFEDGTMYKEGDIGYTSFDSYDEAIFKKNPLLIYTPKNNSKIKGKVVSYPMGMIDVLPTIGNMLNITNPYSLGHDIFTIKDDNIVIFPNGNFLTSKLYYGNSKGKYKVIKDSLIDEEYINSCKLYTEERLKVSNDIIVYDLLKNKK